MGFGRKNECCATIQIPEHGRGSKSWHRLGCDGKLKGLERRTGHIRVIALCLNSLGLLFTWWRPLRHCLTQGRVGRPQPRNARSAEGTAFVQTVGCCTPYTTYPFDGSVLMGSLDRKSGFPQTRRKSLEFTARQSPTAFGGPNIRPRCRDFPEYQAWFYQKLRSLTILPRKNLSFRHKSKENRGKVLLLRLSSVFLFLCCFAMVAII